MLNGCLQLTVGTPNIDEEELKTIPFWVQIRGIPLQLLTRPMIEYVGVILPPVFDVDFDENSTRVDFVRVQRLWNVELPLHFQRNYQFSPGVNTLLSLKYERMHNFCLRCGSLSHEQQECPLDSDDEQLPSEPDEDNDEDGDDDDNGPGPEEIVYEMVGKEDDSDQGLNKRKRVEEGQGSVYECDDRVSDPEVDDEMFWKYAPLAMARAEYDRRMGCARTLSKHRFVSVLVNNLKEVQKEVTGVDSEEEDADDSDHIILEMEERRGAGSVYDYFATSSRLDPSVFGQNMEINISAEGSRSLKRSRPEDIMVDKHQVQVGKLCRRFRRTTLKMRFRWMKPTQ